MSVGTSIRLLRESQGMTQEQLAERLGTSQPRISAIESDKYGERHSLRTLHNVAAALGVELVVRFKVKGGLNDSTSRSLGQQPREEIKVEQEPKESCPVEHQSGQYEMVETVFQQAPAPSFERSIAAMCGS